MVVDAGTVRLAVDALIGFTLVEGALLALYHRVTGRGMAPADFMADLAAGLCLMLALRCALLEAWPWLAACVLAAGAAHFMHLRRAQAAARG